MQKRRKSVFFYGIFFLDLVVALKVVVRIWDFARENQILVRYEDFKDKIARKGESLKIRFSFMFPFLGATKTITDTMKDYILAAKNKVSDGFGVISGGVGTALKSVVPGKNHKGEENRK